MTASSPASVAAEFLPCPFCGSHEVRCCMGIGARHTVECQKCETTGPRAWVAENAATTWNIRAALSRSVEAGDRNAIIEECAKVADPDHGLVFTNADKREAARKTAKMIGKHIRDLKSATPPAPSPSTGEEQ